MNKGKQKLTLDAPTTYQIQVPGQLDESWSEWVEGMTVIVESGSEDQPVTTLTGAFDQAAVVYNRQGATVEMGYVNADFTNNVVTIRAEERLALAVEKPSAIYYGDITA